MIEIHAFHGWGFDALFWDNFKSLIPPEIVFKTADRGYFGNGSIPDFENESTYKLLMTHSYGLHWVPVDKYQEYEVIIIINGFDDFLSSDLIKRKKEERVLKRMIHQFEKSPKSVLSLFYENCFNPEKSTFQTQVNFNHELLLSDLTQLLSTKIKFDPSLYKMISIDGEKDIIKSVSINKQLGSEYFSNQMLTIQNAGHAIPIVNSSECWSFLCKVLPIFAEYANKNGSK